MRDGTAVEMRYIQVRRRSKRFIAQHAQPPATKHALSKKNTNTKVACESWDLSTRHGGPTWRNENFALLSGITGGKQRVVERESVMECDESVRGEGPTHVRE